MRQEKDWSPNRVLYELREKGLSLSMVAARNGVTHQLLSRALYQPSRTSEARIARALGLSPQIIWPSRYASSQRKAA